MGEWWVTAGILSDTDQHGQRIRPSRTKVIRPDGTKTNTNSTATSVNATDNPDTQRERDYFQEIWICFHLMMMMICDGLTLWGNCEDGLSGTALDVRWVAYGAGVCAIICERGVQKLNGCFTSWRTAQPLHTTPEIVILRGVRLRREVKKLKEKEL